MKKQNVVDVGRFLKKGKKDIGLNLINIELGLYGVKNANNSRSFVMKEENKHKVCCFCLGDLQGNAYVCPKCWGNDKEVEGDF